MRLASWIAGRFLLRRGTSLLRTSGVAALAAVALGAAALVVVLSLMNGYRDALRDGILATGGQVVAIWPAGIDDAAAARAAAEVGRIPGVRWAGRVMYLPGLIVPSGGEAAQAVTLKAAEELPSFAALPAASADEPVPIAVGGRLAATLAVAVGDVVSVQVATAGGRLRVFPARVTGIFHTSFTEIDEQWAVASFAAIRSRLRDLRASGIEVGVDDPEHVAAMRARVEAACGDQALVTTWQEANRNLFAALRWQKISLGIVLSLVLGVGALEVGASVVVLVTEKRREIGVLMALGSGPGLIGRTVLLAGGGLGAAGVVLGVGLGAALVAVLTFLHVPSFPPDVASVYMVDSIPLRLQLADLCAVLGLGFVEVCLASLVPARRVARREVVDVLRWV